MTLPKLKYPWFAYSGGKAVVCARCQQWIGTEEPRAWSAKDKSCMHLECHGAHEMGDNGSPREAPAAQPSPERESREAAIERMHAEKMKLLERIAAALEAMKA